MGLTKKQINIILSKLKQYIDKYMGNDGITPHIDESTKHWFIGDTDTGILAEGTSGDNGITPHIDESTKHWFIGDTDTGISANGMEEEELTDEELNALITDTISSLNN